MNNGDTIVNPRREKNEPVLPAVGLLVINPTEALTGLRLAEKRRGRSAFLFNSRLMLMPAGAAGHPFFLAGPAVGAPMAVLTLEKLVALGARRIIVYGWCGSLRQSMSVGDILLPSWAVSDEGTSRHYPVEERPESHGATRLLLAEGLQAQGLTVHTGPVWSTDAPYRESKARVAQLGGQNVLGVDMEFSGLAAAAAFRRVELAAVLLVSDELWSGTWRPGFRTGDFKKKSREVLDFLMDFCARLPPAKL